MKDIQTYLDAGLDFVGEIGNGTQDIWVMSAKVYPRFAWELTE